jgi:hypothetical protein
MTYIPEALRRLVYERADGYCEYCLVHEEFSVMSHEVDHVYSEKHGGETIDENLCLSCATCNRYKGSDLASIDPLIKGDIVVLFHPRKDRWAEHFRIDGALIYPITPQGRVTVRLLHFNDPNQVSDRAGLQRIGRYPTDR